MTIFGGGVFDELNLKWKPPHCGHRAGMEMDFGIKNLNETHRRTADEMLKARKFKVLPESVRVHVKIAGRDTTIKVQDHWHLKYAGPNTYKGPGSTLR